jgi:hypothetical protein
MISNTYVCQLVTSNTYAWQLMASNVHAEIETAVKSKAYKFGLADILLKILTMSFA